MAEESPIVVECRLRPIRLGYIVKPRDSATLRRVFEINTCLWGGMYNCIIPAVSRSPRWWSDAGAKATGPDIVRGYVEAFEPDYLVAPDGDLPKGLSFEKHHVVALDDLLSESTDEHVAYGVNVNEVYRFLYSREYQFVRRHTRRALLSASDDRSTALFTAACFGAFPEGTPFTYFRSNYCEVFDAEHAIADGSSLLDLLQPENGTPLRIGAYGLDVRRRAWSRGPTLFLLDASKPQDLIDFWNLRALGWRIVGIPTEWLDELVGPCREFVKRNNIPYPRNPNLKQSTTLLKSRSVDRATADRFARRISVPGDSPLTLQVWYPRIWDSWARDKDHCQRCEISAKSNRTTVYPRDGRISFRMLSPRFVSRAFWSGSPNWVNVVRLQDYGFQSELGLVVPPGTADLHSVFESYDLDSTSANTEGLVVRCKHPERELTWRLPDGMSICRTWFAQQGFQVELSTAGKIALHLLRTTGGLLGAGALANADLINTLEEMARGATKTKRNLWALFQRINDANEQKAKRHFRSLTNRGIIRLGLALKCPQCGRQNWYSINDTCEHLECSFCSQEFEFPVADPDSAKWSYRVQGPFTVPDFIQGSYTVALALRFLVALSRSEATWVPSMLARREQVGSELEADFVLWRRARFRSEADFSLLIGECKSFRNEAFVNKDIERAKKWALRFPGAAMVFATLREKLSDAEKKRIRRFAGLGRKFVGPEKIRTPVIVLTAHELMSDSQPPYCWEASGLRSRIIGARRDYDSDDLRGLSDTTLQLHVGMEPYAAWESRYFDNLRSRVRRSRGRT